MLKKNHIWSKHHPFKENELAKARINGNAHDNNFIYNSILILSPHQ